jgi:hypothetical protein
VSLLLWGREHFIKHLVFSWFQRRNPFSFSDVHLDLMTVSAFCLSLYEITSCSFRSCHGNALFRNVVYIHFVSKENFVRGLMQYVCVYIYIYIYIVSEFYQQFFFICTSVFLYGPWLFSQIFVRRATKNKHFRGTLIFSRPSVVNCVIINLYVLFTALQHRFKYRKKTGVHTSSYNFLCTFRSKEICQSKKIIGSQTVFCIFVRDL